jgi:formylglycine-generating enzyme required for sulfatase activity
MGHDVFISHSSKDKIVADAVCAALEAGGVRCWIAPRDILPGESWASSILRGIASSRLMVLVFSAHTNSSEQIRREVERAVHRGIAIAPVRIQDVMPEGDMEYFLSSQHWMDALTPPFEKHLKDLSSKVRALLSIGGDPPFAPGPVPAQTPDAPVAKPRDEGEEQLRSLLDLLDADRITPDQYKRGRKLLSAPAAELDEYDASCRAQFLALVQGQLASGKLAAALAGIETQAQKDARGAREQAARNAALRQVAATAAAQRLPAPARKREAPPPSTQPAKPAVANPVPRAAAPPIPALQQKGPPARPAPLPARPIGAPASSFAAEKPAPRPPRKRGRVAVMVVACLLAAALAVALAWHERLRQRSADTASESTASPPPAAPVVLSPEPPAKPAVAPRVVVVAAPPPVAPPNPAPEGPGTVGEPSEFTNSLQMKFVRIEAGEFDMGTPPAEAGHYPEETLHHVRITKPFLMGSTPVTQAQWTAVMGNNPSLFHGDRLPVENVSWDDAVAFCGKLSQKEGKHYRLPTEAEWEYACRAGTKTAFSFGDDEGKLGDYAWYFGNSGTTTHEVGTRKPNPWGLYDMHGNVWQWCSDFYGAYQGDETDPKGPKQGSDTTSRVLRGGSWDIDPWVCRSGFRIWNAPGYRDLNFGFRLVLDSQ